MGQYDNTLKLLVKSSPEAMARFVLHEWQKQQGSDAPEVDIKAVTLLSEEFQSEELKGDGVWLIEGPAGPLYMLEIEYQSTLDPYMPLRSLECLARAKKKHLSLARDVEEAQNVLFALSASEDEGEAE